MKKIITLLLILSFATYCHSQTTNKIYKANYLEYYGGEWHVKETNYPQAMYITLNKNSITITNNENTSIMTYGDVEKNVYEKHTSYSWKAIDNHGDRCTFIMKLDRYGKGEVNGIYFFQKFIGFEYYIDNE